MAGNVTINALGDGTSQRIVANRSGGKTVALSVATHGQSQFLRSKL